MRTLVVGAGATGGYFGGRLADAGRDVTFLVRPARAAALAGGLSITSPGGRSVIGVKTVLAGDLAEPYDMIVVAVKAYALAGAMHDLAPAVGERTVIVPLLNGIRHVDALVTRFEADRVWGGACMIHATLDASGGVVQLTGLHRLVYGPLDGSPDDRLDAVTAELSGAGFDAAASPHIVQDMWDKWVFLASLGAATTLMRSDVGGIVGAPGGHQFTLGIASEAIAVATAAGHPPGRGAVEFLRTSITADAPTTSSLYRDMSRGLPVEADEIVGDFVARGEQHGVRMPLLSAAYTSLAIYARNRG